MASVRWLDPITLPDPDADGVMVLDGADGPVDHFVRVPHVVFRQLMAELGGAEFKVLCFLVDRVYGYAAHRASGTDVISYKQIREGISRHDGAIVTCGTRLSRSSIGIALQALEKAGYIRRTRRARGNGGNAVTAIRLVLPVMAEVAKRTENATPPVR